MTATEVFKRILGFVVAEDVDYTDEKASSRRQRAGRIKSVTA